VRDVKDVFIVVVVRCRNLSFIICNDKCNSITVKFTFELKNTDGFGICGIKMWLDNFDEICRNKSNHCPQVWKQDG